jgi:hypothetical protein
MSRNIIYTEQTTRHLHNNAQYICVNKCKYFFTKMKQTYICMELDTFTERTRRVNAFLKVRQSAVTSFLLLYVPGIFFVTTSRSTSILFCINDSANSAMLPF